MNRIRCNAYIYHSISVNDNFTSMTQSVFSFFHITIRIFVLLEFEIEYFSLLHECIVLFKDFTNIRRRL